jgi:hypothetical protein
VCEKYMNPGLVICAICSRNGNALKIADKSTKATASASGNMTTTSKEGSSKSFYKSSDCDIDDDFQPHTTHRSKPGRGVGEGGGQETRKTTP